MKHPALGSILLLIAIGAGIMCQPKKVDPTLIGKLVIDTVCAHYVIALEQGSADASHFAPEWTDTNTHILYVNAFAVSNRCDFAANDLSIGDRFSFTFEPDHPVTTCIVCLIDYPLPPVSNSVYNVHKIN